MCISGVLAQIGLGISETEHIGDDEGEMGENLQMVNLEGWLLLRVAPCCRRCCLLLLLLSVAAAVVGGGEGLQTE